MTAALHLPHNIKEGNKEQGRNTQNIMKKFIAVTDVEGAGMEALGGEHVLLFCLNYIYAGILSGVNETFVQLTEAKIVYETGPFTSSGYKDAQLLPGDTWNVQRGAIESFGRGK